MNEVRNILVGLSINRDTSQLCYYDRKAGDAVSVPTKVGTNLYAFPTALLKAPEENVWHIGFEAEYFEKKGEGIPIRNLLAKLTSGFTITIDGKKMSAPELLAVFILESLKLLGIPNPVKSIRGIGVTTKDLTPEIALSIREALLYAGFAPDAASVMPEEECFYYYGYSQRPEIWTRGLMLIRFDGNHVSCDRMTEMRARKPFLVTVSHRGEIDLPMDSTERDEAFAQAVDEWGGSILCSGIFITGDGFSPSWAKRSIRALSRAASHVFEGDNLFVKGACFGVYEKMERHAFKDRFYLGDHLVRSSLDLMVLDAGTPSSFTLIHSGIGWYENASTAEIILGGEDGGRDEDAEEEVPYLTFRIRPMEREKHGEIRMELPDLPVSSCGMTRLLIEARCESAERFLIRAEDLGFGEFQPASHRVYTETVDLSEVEI